MKKALSIILALVMVFSLSLTAFAASPGNVNVNGRIGTQGDPSIDPTDPTYDITLSTSVYWWVTQDNPATVANGTSTGPGTVNNLIRNNKIGTTISVSFDEFLLTNETAKDVDADLTLFLTGDLAEDDMGDIDLSGGYSDEGNTCTDPTPGYAAVPYTESLVYGTDWTFGFTGAYSGDLTATMLTPTYTMTLGFAFE